MSIDLTLIEWKQVLPQSGCPLCRLGRQRVCHYLQCVLHEYVNDGSVRARLGASWGYCTAHAWMLTHLEEEKLTVLTGELSEYLRKHEYRYAHEPPGPEWEAYLRATEMLVGRPWEEILGQGRVSTLSERREREILDGGPEREE